MDLEAIQTPARADILALVPIATVKAEQRFNSMSEDWLIGDFICQAYGWFDGPHGWFRRAILPQRWTYYRRDFPRAAIAPMYPYPFLDAAAKPFQIPMPPLTSVDEIAYRDETGAWQVVDPSVYEVLTRADDFGAVTLALGQEWPTLIPRERAVRVKFTAGYEEGKVPDPILRCIRFLAGYFFMNRNVTFEDTRVTTIDRKIVYGIEAIGGRFRFPNDLVESF